MKNPALTTYIQKTKEEKPDRCLNLVVGKGGTILPCKVGFQGYFAEFTEDSIIFTNDVLDVQKEIPYTAFRAAEFGIGNAQLWLQCIVGDSPFVFCMRRKQYKSAVGQFMLDKLEAVVGNLRDDKDYKGYTGKLFFLYLWK